MWGVGVSRDISKVAGAETLPGVERPQSVCPTFFAPPWQIGLAQPLSAGPICPASAMLLSSFRCRKCDSSALRTAACMPSFLLTAVRNVYAWKISGHVVDRTKPVSATLSQDG